MSAYLGHRSRAAWNVSLWILNDEPLYQLALSLKRRLGTKKAASMLLRDLPAKTPDGYRYTYTSIREALSGLE